MSDTAWEPLKRWLIEEQAIDESVVTAEALKRLDLSGRSLEELPESIGLLSGLVALNLAGNNLKTLPDSLSNLSMLNNLDIRRNRFEAVPSVLSSLTLLLGLQEADLTSNQLKDLYLHDLDDLEIMILDSNPIQKIEVDESFAPYLKEFSCDSCELQTFVWVPSLELASLCFSSNAITTVPEEIGKYTKLRQLDLDGNGISELPNAVANMTRLQTLYIGGNPLNEEAKKVIKVLHPDICDINMKTGITIERAQEEDLPEMAELIGVLFAIEVDFEIDYEKQLAGIKKLHVYEGADMLVAKHEGKVVGMVTMQRLISSAAGDFIGQIEDLVVHEEYRKMGVGSRLINKMRFIAIEEYGYKRIQLAADMDNTNALQFYTRRGFRRTNLNVYHLEKN
jgi:Leucine-rich repeat (LRR) protein/predicted GNAT family N-acyltransferase